MYFTYLRVPPSECVCRCLSQAHLRHVKSLISIASYGQHCVLATQVEEPDSSTGQFALVLCNAISTPVDSELAPMLGIRCWFCFVAVCSYVWKFKSENKCTFTFEIKILIFFPVHNCSTLTDRQQLAGKHGRNSVILIAAISCLYWYLEVICRKGILRILE